MGNPTPANRGSQGAAVLPFLQWGNLDPTVFATAGELGSLYLQIPSTNTDPPGSHGLFEKTVDSGENTNWQRIGSGSGPTPSEIDYKDPVDTVNAFGTNINLAAPGAVINGVTMVAGMSFLVVDQTNSVENGIYDWNGAAVPATRRADCVDPYVTKGMFTWVNTGPTNRALTGWILTTANPIVVDTTPLVFTQIPVNSSQSTRIAGLYWVAGNGNDTNPTTRGAIAAPFATIQAAINQAVAEGHGNANPAQIFVLPKAGNYASFTTAPGISVHGKANNNFLTRCSGVIISPDGTGINNNTGASISNLQFTATGAPALSFPAGNQGRWTLYNCRFVTNTVGQVAVSMNNAGSVLNMFDCDIFSSVAEVGIDYLAGGNLLIRNCTVQAGQQALRVAAGAVWNAVSSSFSCSGIGAAAYVIDNDGICQSAHACQFVNNPGLAGAILIRGSGTMFAFNCGLYTNLGTANYEVQAGGVLFKRNLIFSGSTYNVIVNGTVNTLEDSEDLVVDVHIVSGPEAAAKQFDLPKYANNANINLTCAGAPQAFGTDFTVAGFTLSWAALGMDALPVVAGDQIITTYMGSPRL